MGDYVVHINGAPIKVKVVDDERMIEQLIPSYFGSEDVFGIDQKDIITYIHKDKKSLFVIVGGSSCLIIHRFYSTGYYHQLSSSQPEVLKNFLVNSERCFVKPSDKCLWCSCGVSLGELAARVLKQPAFLTEKGLEIIARQVQVPYKDAYASSDRRSDGSILVYREYDIVLTPAQIERVIYDAVTCYKVANKLLKALKVQNDVILA